MVLAMSRRLRSKPPNTLQNRSKVAWLAIRVDHTLDTVKASRRQNRLTLDVRKPSKNRSPARKSVSRLGPAEIGV